MTAETEHPPAHLATERSVRLPAPTAWPFALAFGVTLMSAGLVTNLSVSLLGVLIAICGVIGWFRDVLPQERHESVPVDERVTPVATVRRAVAPAAWVTPELQRARLPLEIYPISAGVKGGLAGGVAMAMLAALYGIVSGRGIWYPINVLAGGFFPGRTSLAELSAFHADTLIIGSAIHLISSLLVGVLYGATLPMLPRRPILFGGIIAPVLWSGLLHGLIDVFNPGLNQRIDWLWFAISQVGFGIVAGIVVSRQERVRTWQHLPFAVRAGMEHAAGHAEQGDGPQK